MNFREGTPVLLIDASYFVFYRYYATQRWFMFRSQRANPPTEPPAPSDPEFLEAFAKQARSEIGRLISAWKSCPENTVFCCDCSRGAIWRTAVFLENSLADMGMEMGLGGMVVVAGEAEGVAEGDAGVAAVMEVPSSAMYKGTRATPTNFYGDIFPHFYQLLRSGQLGAGLRRADGEQLEADDVVYGIVKTLREGAGGAEGGGAQVVCISNDNDYLQLLRFPNLLVYNLQDKNLAERSCGCSEKDLLVKILSGDKSDNIPPCARGIGPKTALKVAEMTDTERRSFLEKKGGAAALTTFARNRQLVDFRHIPEDLLQKLTLI